MKDSNLNDLVRSLTDLPERERKLRIAEFFCRALPTEDENEVDSSKDLGIQQALANAFYIPDSPKISEHLFSQLPSDDRMSQLVSSILGSISKASSDSSTDLKWESKHLDFASIRYRGDVADLKKLVEIYDIEAHIDRQEEEVRGQQLHQRQKLLVEGTPLENFEPFERVKALLGSPAEIELYLLPGLDVNASAILTREESGNLIPCIGITQGALDLLDHGEIAFLLGHEMGHFLFDNHRMNGLLCWDQEQPAATILSPSGESLFLRWRQKAELSADRIGLLACGDLQVAVSALVKTEFGSLAPKVTLDLDALLSQISDLVDNSDLDKDTLVSHPLLPIRVRALQLFSRSAKARKAGFPAANEVLSDEELCNRVDALLKYLKRSPKAPLEVAAMNAVVLGGIAVLSADKKIRDPETKILVEILFRHFADEPEEVLCHYYASDMNSIAVSVGDLLKDELKKIRDEAGTQLKYFILSRLIDIGMADGVFLKEEENGIYKIANEIGVTTAEMELMVDQAYKASGYTVDRKLNRAAADLKRNLLIGLYQSGPEEGAPGALPGNAMG